MDKKHILSIVIVFISLFLFAEKNIDQQIIELEQKLVRVSGKEKVDILNDIAFKLRGQSSQKSLDYANQAFTLSQKINYPKGTGTSLNNLGTAYMYLGKYDKALECFLKLLKTNEALWNKAGIAYSFINIGCVYYYIGKYDMALEYFSKSSKDNEKIENKALNAAYFNSLVFVYQKLGKYNKALEYCLKLEENSEATGNKAGIAVSLIGIGGVYHYFNNYDKALEYYLKSLKLSEGTGDKDISASCLVELAKTYIKLNDLSKAFTSLNRGLKIARELKGKKSIADYYETFTDYYVAREDFRNALKYHKLFHDADKEIFNEKIQKQINELQAGYEAEKRKKEIKLLKKDKELLNKDKALLTKENKIKTFVRNSFIIGFILILIILGLLFNKYLYLFAFWKKHSYIGQYRIIEKIGSGGMGTIYKAKNITDKTQTVAIKVLNEELLKDETQRKRFSRESLIIDQLEHPNIIKIYERGEDKKSSFIVMEFLSGKTLSHILPDNTRLPLIDSLPVMIQISDALVQIHGKNIIHRDLNPNNIMLIEKDGNQNFVKLLDFGLARSAFETTITQAGYALGTIRYMSPEQLIGNKNITIKSDIFSLGIIFYEMVTGTRAFSLEIGEVANDILNKLLTEPIKIKPDLPVALNQLIMHMIEKDPQTRPAIEDVLKTLKEISR